MRERREREIRFFAFVYKQLLSFSADGNWQAKLPDVTGKDDDRLHYVIEYTLRDSTSHRIEGSARLAGLFQFS